MRFRDDIFGFGCGGVFEFVAVAVVGIAVVAVAGE